MSLKIHKHFSPTTPFSEAENDEELAKIMRLKYPRACSSLETGAEFFARMVEDVRKFEAWRVIGFASFEEFCREKLGRTITEVEEIVEGVKLLGGNPTEAEAKKASRSQRAADLVRAGTHTQAEAAAVVGVTQPAISKALNITKNKANQEKVISERMPMLRMTKDPAKTARNIISKMGLEYALKLSAEITTI
jgi:hypothetical protein